MTSDAVSVLRDRIAAVIRDHGTPVGLDTGEMDEFDCCAQAIIEDLGLTVDLVPSFGNAPPHYRIVGDWVP